jgi:hypothetical protein
MLETVLDGPSCRGVTSTFTHDARQHKDRPSLLPETGPCALTRKECSLVHDPCVGQAMIIRRANRAGRFTIIDNDVIEDNELSFRALGLLTYILSKPDNWKTDSISLARGRTEGRDAVRASLTDLELAGYITRDRVRKGRAWVTETVVYDRPCDREIGEITSNNSSGDGFSGIGASGVGNPGAKTLSTDNKDCKQEDLGRRRRATATEPPKGRIISRPDEESPADEEPPNMGASPKKPRKSAAAAGKVAAERGDSGFGLAKRFDAFMLAKGTGETTNLAALAKNLNGAHERGQSREEQQAMIELFVSNIDRYRQGDKPAWIAFWGAREKLRADVKAVEAAGPNKKRYGKFDPYAEMKTKKNEAS